MRIAAEIEASSLDLDPYRAAVWEPINVFDRQSKGHFSRTRLISNIISSFAHSRKALCGPPPDRDRDPFMGPDP